MIMSCRSNRLNNSQAIDGRSAIDTRNVEQRAKRHNECRWLQGTGRSDNNAHLRYHELSDTFVLSWSVPNTACQFRFTHRSNGKLKPCLGAF